MDDIQQKLFPLLSFIWNLDKLDKRMWHPDMKLPHIRKTHPYFSVCSFKMGGTLRFPPICDQRPDHMTGVEAAISGLCVSFCREKHTQPPE